MGNNSISIGERLKRLLLAFIWLITLGAFAMICVLYQPLFDNAVLAFIRSGFLLALIPITLVSLVIIALTRQRLLFVMTIPSIIVIGMYLYPYFAPKSAAVQTGETTIRLMTFNVLNLRDPNSIAQFTQLITETAPTVIAFQEFGEGTHNRLIEQIGDDYPYTSVVRVDGGPRFSGQALYSKYPIIEEESWFDTEVNTTHPQQRVVLDVNGTAVAIYNIHPYPPINWVGGPIFVATEADMLAHAVAMEHIISRVSADTMPKLVVGDMNMSDQFPEYNRLSQLVTDSFIESGYGLGFTYPANTSAPPLMRLDYVFHSYHFVTVNVQVLRDTGTSDHLPVIADLVLN